MKNHNRLFLSLDIGTTAIKVGLFTAEGKLLAIEKREQKLIFPKLGRVEQSVQYTWQLIAGSIREILKNHPPDAVSAIALSVQRGSVISIDAKGNPLGDQIVWMDNRGLPYVEWLKSNLGLETYYQISGHGLSHITGISKLLWLRHEDPEKWEKTKVIGTPQTLLLKWLGCDNFVCDLSSGTYFFPFDIDHKVWSLDLAEKLDFPIQKLPRLVLGTEIVGQLSHRAANELGLNPGISLVAGGGDGQCAAAGCGVIAPGMGMINIGTGAGVQCFLSEPVRDPACVIPVAAHVVPDGWEMEAHTQASGAVFRWLRDEFGSSEIHQAEAIKADAFDLLVDEARDAPSGSGGLLLIPTFNGSTGPRVELNSRGVLMGLTLSHEKRHVIRAFLEGITLELRWMLDAISQIGVPLKELRLSGGGARNPYWNQIHADILSHPVCILDQSEAALVGAAMCAAVAAGEYKNLTEAASQFVRVRETIHPDVKNFPVYQAAYDRYREVYNLFCDKGIFTRLAELASLSQP